MPVVFLFSLFLAFLSPQRKSLLCICLSPTFIDRSCLLVGGEEKQKMRLPNCVAFEWVICLGGPHPYGNEFNVKKMIFLVGVSPSLSPPRS